MGERADKSRNIYKINPSNYYKILKRKITDTYNIDRNDTITKGQIILPFIQKWQLRF